MLGAEDAEEDEDEDAPGGGGGVVLVLEEPVDGRVEVALGLGEGAARECLAEAHVLQLLQLAEVHGLLGSEHAEAPVRQRHEG